MEDCMCVAISILRLLRGYRNHVFLKLFVDYLRAAPAIADPLLLLMSRLKLLNIFFWKKSISYQSLLKTFMVL